MKHEVGQQGLQAWQVDGGHACVTRGKLEIAQQLHMQGRNDEKPLCIVWTIQQNNTTIIPTMPVSRHRRWPSQYFLFHYASPLHTPFGGAQSLQKRELFTTHSLQGRRL